MARFGFLQNGTVRFPKFKSPSILPLAQKKEVPQIVSAALSENIFTCGKTSTTVIADDDNYKCQAKQTKLDYASHVSDFADEPKDDENDEIIKYMTADFSADGYYSEHHMKF